MGSPNGGIIGVINPTSFGKCTVTTATTGSTTLTTQPGTRLAAILQLLLVVEEVDQIEEVAVEQVVLFLIVLFQFVV
jgi:hypothetical protein